MTEEEGGEAAAEEEEIWQAILERKAGELAGEDTEMVEKNFPGSWADRRRLWPENEEEREAALSEVIGVQWENIADIVVYLWEA